MTKQERIAEMAVIGCVRNPQAHTVEECLKCDFNQGQCNAYRHAESLYSAGYHKDKEIRKETAKEILNIGKKLYEMSYHKSNAMPRLIEWIKVEYGVEVEE